MPEDAPVPALPQECSAVALTTEEIAAKVVELGERITRAHAGHPVRLVTVLRGGLFFLSDLCRAIDLTVTLDFLAVSTFAQGEAGRVRVTKDLDDDIAGSHVILVEDVLDTGLTANFVRGFLASHSPTSLEVCALIDKPARRIVPIVADYVGFPMSDRFLVGYGLDLAGRHRNLPYVAELRPEMVLT